MPLDVDAPTKFDEEASASKLDVAPRAESLPQGCFACTLQHNAGGHGLAIDSWPAFLQVIGLVAGSARSYNCCAPARERILPNDLIVAVNGATGSREMLEKLESQTPLDLTVVRPVNFSVKIGKGASAFGLKLAIHKSVSTCVWIEEIEEGAVQAYNAAMPMDERICPRDLIESVNGIRGSATRMVEELCSSSVIDLVLLRVPNWSRLE